MNGRDNRCEGILAGQLTLGMCILYAVIISMTALIPAGLSERVHRNNGIRLSWLMCCDAHTFPFIITPAV